MNYKVYFDNNKASHCEHVKNRNDIADYTTVNHIRLIKSLVVNALSEEEALIIANRLAAKLIS